MPAKSRKQQKWAFANKGEAWARAHHMDKVVPSKKRSAKKRKK